MNYASNGNGTSSHLAAGMLKSEAGIEMTYIPYKGGGPAMQDLIGGQVDMLFDLMVWFGWLALKGTPDEVIQRVNKEINTALANPEFQERLASMGVTPMPGTPKEFSDFLASETERWGKVVRESGAAIN